jgi:hypothetical protein
MELKVKVVYIESRIVREDVEEIEAEKDEREKVADGLHETTRHWCRCYTLCSASWDEHAGRMDESHVA